MKKSLLALAVLGTLSATALAQSQSNVTVYGVIDLSVMKKTNVDTVGGHSVSLGDSSVIGDGGQGALSGSRLGFKGVEDLGGNTSALFVMESGLTASNGQSDQQGQLFGRQSYVGLENKDLGKLTLGRQYGVGADFMFDYDPLGLGNYMANAWEAFLFGIRFDNTTMYSKQFGDVAVKVQYSLGEQGGNSTGTTKGLNVKYARGPLTAGGVYQTMRDANSNDSNAMGVGATYTVGPATLYGNYYNVKTDAGFAKAASLSGGALANTSMLINTVGNVDQRKDSLGVVGMLYNFTPLTSVTVAYMHDKITHDAGAGKHGMLSTIYALADHRLSKRTNVYLSVDYAKAGGQELLSGGTINGIVAGQSNSADISVGLRHRF